MDSAKTHHLFKLSGMELGLYIYSAMFSTLQSRARVNIKQASVQTPGSSVFVVWNARGFDFWRMNRRTYSTFRYTLIQQSSFRILYETIYIAWVECHAGGVGKSGSGIFRTYGAASGSAIVMNG